MTAIEWAEETWNPVTGCDRISPGCDHCYALTMAARLKAMGQPAYQRDGDPRTSGPGFGLTLHEHRVDQPLSWRKPRLVFVNSMSDLFHRGVPEDFIARVFTTMDLAGSRHPGGPGHTFQVLTKRPKRMARVLDRMYADWSAEDGLPWKPIPNVWLGTSIETNGYHWRADHLRAAPAAVRFISAEPLLGPIPWLDLTHIDWLIVGGESGRGARPMSLTWVRELAAKCDETGTALFVKQLGGVLGRQMGAGAKGGKIEAWPEDLRRREMPKVPAA